MIKFWFSGIIIILFATCGPSVTVDTLPTGGQVVDGTGAVPYMADVGIRGDRIVFIGHANRERVSAGRTIDAAGTGCRAGIY